MSCYFDKINQIRIRMTDYAKSGFQHVGNVFNFIGGISGLITCGAVLISGGRYTRQVDIDSERITAIERGGSPSMIAHEKKDDERVDDIKRRLNKMEDAVILLTDVKGRLGVIDERIDSIGKKVLVQQEQLNLLLQTSKPKL